MPRPPTELKELPNYKRVTTSYHFVNGSTYTVEHINHLLADGVTQWTRVYSGAVTPNYKYLLLKHGKKNVRKFLPILSYNLQLTKDMPGRYTIETKSYSPLYQGGHYLVSSGTLSTSGRDGVSLPPILTVDVSCRNAALSRLHEKINHQAHLGMLFAERKQVVNSIVKRAEQFSLFFESLMRRRYKEAARHLGINPKNWVSKEHRTKRYTNTEQEIASAWLEWKYGWSPLISDIHDTMELFNERLNNDSFYINVRASKKTYQKSTENASNPADKIQRTTREAMTKYSFSLNYTPENDLKQAFQSCGVTNPALIAWELVPYSFVVDWFIPIGDYLERLTMYDGLLFHSGCESLLHQHRTHLSYYGTTRFGGTGDYSVQTRTGSTARDNISFSRVALHEFPRQEFAELRSPIPDEPLDRFYTAYALMRNGLKRK